MPNTFNGIGTTYYGQSDFEQDDSFITTKWFVLGYFPCAPLGSLRVRQIQSEGIPLLSRSTAYEVIEEQPTNWAQVLRIWAFTAFMFFVFGQVLSSRLPPVAQFLVLALAVFIPTLTRAFAKRRA